MGNKDMSMILASLRKQADEIVALRKEVNELRGLAESCEYYMNLSDTRGKQVDALRIDRTVPVPEQITTRCTYLMTQEDLND